MTHKEAMEVSLDIARLLDEKKAKDVKVIDVEELTHLYDFIIIASGSSVLYLKSLVRYIEFRLGELGIAKLNTTKDKDNPWILIDCGFVVIHLFVDELRSFYNIEKLWGSGLSIYEGSYIV